MHGQRENRCNAHAKSTVIPNGVPSSSLRAYLLPIDTLDESTRDETPDLRSFEACYYRTDRVNISLSHAQLQHTDLLYERLKAIVGRYRDNEDFDRCDQGWEG